MKLLLHDLLMQLKIRSYAVLFKSLSTFKISQTKHMSLQLYLLLANTTMQTDYDRLSSVSKLVVEVQ